MSQGQFGYFVCHLTVLEAGDDGNVILENETSSEAKWVTNFISGPRKKYNFKRRSLAGPSWAMEKGGRLA